MLISLLEFPATIDHLLGERLNAHITSFQEKPVSDEGNPQDVPPSSSHTLGRSQFGDYPCNAADATLTKAMETAVLRLENISSAMEEGEKRRQVLDQRMASAISS